MPNREDLVHRVERLRTMRSTITPRTTAVPAVELVEGERFRWGTETFTATEIVGRLGFIVVQAEYANKWLTLEFLPDELVEVQLPRPAAAALLGGPSA